MNSFILETLTMFNGMPRVETKQLCKDRLEMRCHVLSNICLPFSICFCSQQVGIRCRHCTGLESWERARGAVYYSATLDGLYQAAQNMAKNHLCKHCKLIPSNTKAQLLELRDSKQRAAGGKTYWADSARVLGVQETQNGLRFRMSTMTQ